MRLWSNVYDRLARDEMPPEDAGQPSPESRKENQERLAKLHSRSHHGMDPQKIKQLTPIESEHFKAYANFLDQLKETREADSNLLDRTMILYGSHLGNASSHNNTDMPIFLAGGGFKHGRHLAFGRETIIRCPDFSSPCCSVSAWRSTRLPRAPERWQDWSPLREMRVR
jgi:hypothetical protein